MSKTEFCVNGVGVELDDETVAWAQKSMILVGHAKSGAPHQDHVDYNRRVREAQSAIIKTAVDAFDAIGGCIVCEFDEGRCNSVHCPVGKLRFADALLRKVIDPQAARRETSRMIFGLPHSPFAPERTVSV